MLLLKILAAAASEPIDIVLRGVCDGSAAVRAPNASLLVAYDEDRSLHLYGAHGGRRLATRSLAKELKLDRDNELDLEGAAATSHTLWWVASHGNNKDGKQRPNRQVLFGTTVPQSPDLTDLHVSHAAVDLIPILRAGLPSVLHNGTMRRPPKEGGLNVEGLAIYGDGLVVGLRSPLASPDGLEGHALLMVLAPSGKSWKTTAVHRLDLGNRGVRSLTWTGEEYLIIAGPVDRSRRFKLFRWEGKGTTVTEVDAPLAGLNPEALVALGSGRWAVLSDDGAVERVDWKGGRDGMSRCKDIRARSPQGADHPSVYSRGRVFSLPF